MYKCQKTLRVSFTLSIFAFVTGCSLAPDYQRPDVLLGEYRHSENVQNNYSGDDNDEADYHWQSFVTDAELRDLISLALANNYDLRQTILNVEAARATYRIQRSERLPSVSAQANSVRQRLPEDLRPQGTPAVQSQYQMNLGIAQYELDLFGRIGSLSEAAMQEYLAEEEMVRAAELSLIAEVSRAYILRNSVLQRRGLARETLSVREESLALIQQRLAAGAATELDYQQALGLVQQVNVSLQQLEREVQQSTNALLLLLGNPAGIILHDDPMDGYMLVQNVQAGLPSDLLERRPDIRAAERRLISRNARIGAARAAFFPGISLTGTVGNASADLSDLFSSGQGAWSFMPVISIPLFTAGRNKANLELAHIRKSMAIQSYEYAIQSAFTEVQNALAAATTLADEEDARRTLLDTYSESRRLSELRYNAGMDDYLRYLEAQRSEFDARIGLVNTETERQLALVSLFRSLGGGWRVVPTNDDEVKQGS